MTINQLIKQLQKVIWPINNGKFNESPILRERDARPSHYSLRIENFSELSEEMYSDYITNDFSAGGYKWNLQIYPNGDKENQGEGYISIYLQLGETSRLGSEVIAIYNFFIYDQIQDKYLCLQDTKEKRFHSMNTRWGTAKFIDLETFKNPSKGYLVNGNCIFGAEVFIINDISIGECLSMISKPKLSCKYTWKFDDFSQKICDESYKSDTFIGGDYKWRILLNPKGYCAFITEGISVGIELDTSVLPPNTKLLANFIVRVIDQTEREEHYPVDGTAEFFSSSYGRKNDCGSPKDTYSMKICDFMSLTEFQNPKMGYLVNDQCIIEAEIDVLTINGQYHAFY